MLRRASWQPYLLRLAQSCCCHARFSDALPLQKGHKPLAQQAPAAEAARVAEGAAPPRPDLARKRGQVEGQWAAAVGAAPMAGPQLEMPPLLSVSYAMER